MVRYDVAQRQTTLLGRPSQWTLQYMYPNRYLIVDSRGIVYTSAGNEFSQWHMGESEEIYAHLYSWNPQQQAFVDLPSMQLQGTNSIDCGQWNRDRTSCYMSDDKGHLYRFTDEGPSFEYLGRLQFPNAKTWSLNVSADEEVIYMIGSDMGLTPTIYAFDIGSGQTTALCALSEIDNRAGAHTWACGYDTWDRSGNFYINSFSQTGPNCILTRFNPVRFKAARGTLPSLLEAGVRITNEEFEIYLNETQAQASEILWQAEGLDAAGNVVETLFGTATVTQSQLSATIATQTLSFNNAGIRNIRFTIVPDGNDYIAADMNNEVLSTSPFSSLLNNPDTFQASVTHDGQLKVVLQVTRPSDVRVCIHDIRGGLLQVLFDSYLSSGSLELFREMNISLAASAVYLVRARIRGQSAERLIVKRL
jgi:hypothetical protein